MKPQLCWKIGKCSLVLCIWGVVNVCLWVCSLFSSLQMFGCVITAAAQVTSRLLCYIDQWLAVFLTAHVIEINNKSIKQHSNFCILISNALTFYNLVLGNVWPFFSQTSAGVGAQIHWVIMANHPAPLPLREFCPLYYLLNAIPAKVQKGFRSVLVYLTSLDSNNDYIAIGSSIGMLYLYCRRVSQMNKYNLEVSLLSASSLSLFCSTHRGSDLVRYCFLPLMF